MHHDTSRPEVQAPPSRIAQVCATDEEGAQAVEYAMIGGVGAALISLLWAILDKTNLIDKLLGTIIDGLLDLVTGWF